MEKNNEPLLLEGEPDAANDSQTKNLQNNIDKPEEMSWGDYMLKDRGVLSPRHRELARMLAAGAKNKEICEALSYTPGRVSVLKSNTRIKQEVERLQDKLFEEDIEKRLKGLNHDAASVVENILIDPDLKLKEKESAARWLLEKTTGKPAQAVDLKGEINVGIFMDQIESMIDSGQVIDVSPKPAALAGDDSRGSGDSQSDGNEQVVEADPLADWVNANI